MWDLEEEYAVDPQEFLSAGKATPFEGAPNVQCLPYDKNVQPYYHSAHAVVLPSYHEGMANVLLEAAATARPVLASDIPGCRETFDEGVTGFGFEPKSAPELLRAVKRFLALSPEQRREMGENGRKKMENQFDRKLVVQKYFDEIE